MKTLELAVLPIEAERKDLDSLRFLAINGTLSAVHQSVPEIPYYGPDVRANIRGEAWQDYAHQLAFESRKTIEHDARIFHPCQPNIASALGRSLLSKIHSEQDIRLQAYAEVIPEEIVAEASMTEENDKKVLSMIEGYEWSYAKQDENTLASVVGQIACDVLFTKTLARLREEKTKLISHLTETA